MRFKSKIPILALLGILLLINQVSGQNSKRTVAEKTKDLLTTFLIDENMERLEAMIDDAVKFHWPNRKVFDKAVLMKACQNVMTNNQNHAEIIDLVEKEDKGYVMFVWSGTVDQNPNTNLNGKEFSVHDFWRVTWKGDKIVDWYTIYGSESRKRQLGYTITEP
ncbi:MAG: hypothetical protein HKN87_09640 [Saprospiraceae bacterium]|nr:hypothetical protein [Saprospiraceae bacterium]